MAKRKTTAKIRTFEGLPVVDADQRMTLHIMPNDIEKANKKNPALCAAARAAQRELGTDVRVFLTRTYVKHAKKWVRFLTPQSVGREIVSFDRGATFEPGEYTFTPAPPAARLGVVRSPTPKNRQREGTTARTAKARHVTGNIRERGKYDAATKPAKKRA
jgi:hypothetical protein